MRITQEASYLMVIQHKGTMGYLVGILIATVGVLFLLNVFLGDTFSYNQIIVPSVLILIGFFMIVLTSQVTLTLDKEKNRISYIEERILSGKTEERELKQISEVQLREKVEMRRGQISQYYTLALTFKDNKPDILVHFPRSRILFFKSGNKNVEEISQKIANFLGVRLMRPPSLTQAIGTAAGTIMQATQNTPSPPQSSVPQAPK